MTDCVFDISDLKPVFSLSGGVGDCSVVSSYVPVINVNELYVNAGANLSGSLNLSGNVKFKNRLLQRGNVAQSGYLSLANNSQTSLSAAGANKSLATFASRTTPQNNLRSICWSPRLSIFAAVSANASSTSIITSSDGINWILATTPAGGSWNSVCWAPQIGLFCAVGGGSDRVMTSSNGSSWAAQVTAPSQAVNWTSVCWSPELRLFCAVANTGGSTTSRIMTSPNGVNWTSRATATNDLINTTSWASVCWSPELGLFCAVGSGANRVMTSSNGITWQLIAAPNDQWSSVCWSSELGLFVAVSEAVTGSGSGSGSTPMIIRTVMISSNGISWRTVQAPANNWKTVTWSPTLGSFLAAGESNYWSTKLSGTADDTGYAVSATGNDNGAYVVGTYASNPLSVFNIDGSVASTLANAGSENVFLAKYNKFGTSLWSARLSGTGIDNGYSTASIDNANNENIGLYVTGFFGSASLIVYNSNGSTTRTLTNGGSSDVFLAKYDTNGVNLWATKLSSVDGDTANSVCNFGIDGGSYITGFYNSALTIYNYDDSVFATLPHSAGRDIFVIKYNAAGVAQWATRITGPLGDVGSAVAKIDVNGVNSALYVAGTYKSNPINIYNADGLIAKTLLNGIGARECFVIRYNSAGYFLWNVKIVGEDSDTLYSLSSIVNDGGFYAGGHFASSQLMFYNSDETLAMSLANSNTGTFDAFLAKYRPDGRFLWAAKLGGTVDNFMFSVASIESADLTNNGVYATGYFGASNLLVYNSNGALAATLPSSGSTDVFIVRYNSEGFVQWVTRLVGTSPDIGYSVSPVLNDNGVYVTGYYSTGTLTIYNSDSTVAGILTNSGGRDAFLLKYNSFGIITNLGNLMRSRDGVNWTQLSPTIDRWSSSCWSPELGIFALTDSSSTAQVLTSSLTARPPTSQNVFDLPSNSIGQNGNWKISCILKSITTTATTATPIVTGQQYIIVSNLISTTITDFTGGAVGQRLTLSFTNANTIISNVSPNIKLRAAFTSSADDTISFICVNNSPSLWLETQRSAN